MTYRLHNFNKDAVLTPTHTNTTPLPPRLQNTVPGCDVISFSLKWGQRPITAHTAPTCYSCPCGGWARVCESRHTKFTIAVLMLLCLAVCKTGYPLLHYHYTHVTVYELGHPNFTVVLLILQYMRQNTPTSLSFYSCYSMWDRTHPLHYRSTHVAVRVLLVWICMRQGFVSRD